MNTLRFSLQRLPPNLGSQCQVSMSFNNKSIPFLVLISKSGEPYVVTLITSDSNVSGDVNASICQQAKSTEECQMSIIQYQGAMVAVIQEVVSIVVSLTMYTLWTFHFHLSDRS